jgi:hypothetical protein
MVTKNGVLNLNLIKAPEDVVSYIVLHELCHLKIRDIHIATGVYPANLCQTIMTRQDRMVRDEPFEISLIIL